MATSRINEKQTEYIMKTLTFALAVAIIAATLLGCRSDDSTPIELPLEKAIAILYRESATDEHPAHARLFGGGALVSRTVGGARRYYIATANHVSGRLREPYNFASVQVGLPRRGSEGRITRLRMPANGGARWSVGDIRHDVIVCDVTESLAALESQLAEFKFIDLDRAASVDSVDSAGAGCSQSTRRPGDRPPYQAEEITGDDPSERLLEGVGAATSNDYSRIGVRKGKVVTCVATNGKESAFVNPPPPEGYEWTSPCERRCGPIKEMFVEKTHKFIDNPPVGGPMAGYLMIHSVLTAEFGARNGDSGSPAFVRGRDGHVYFLGLAIGADERITNIAPVDYIISEIESDYAAKTAIENTKKNQ